jgi:hypothetical protein
MERAERVRQHPPALTTNTPCVREGTSMADANCTVVYKDIPGFPGYRVGDDGSVWSCWAKKGRGRAPGGKGLGVGYVISDQWRRMRTYPNSKGYWWVRLCRKGVPVANRRVHHLVLLAFVGPCPEGMEACHFPDRDPSNNRLGNLRWDTHRANCDDRAAHGTAPRGERNGNAKFTAETVRRIRAEYAAGGVSQSQLARKYGTSQNHVSSIVLRRCWRDIK